MDYQEKKRAKNVSINNKILDEAEKLNLNLSAILEDSLFYYIYKASDEEREKYSKKKS
ncbi:type II toxin-antitoxin system CcdA family antitoxin [Enterococcus sp. AZ191]|uniref:type II toxin-antitoxin system CcdA family antitoxin n=1 Tax=Enterococcus sp. AZ191 TaxID=2774639 RepID=UPI003F686972